MRPGRRDDLIALFEREFIETQEACGMLPVGHYRNLDDPDEFVWLRGFPGMDARREALEAFYGRSEAWRRNREAANATMLDSDNVLLLRPANAARGFDLSGLQRPPQNAAAASSVVGIAVFMLHEPPEDAQAAALESQIVPALQRCAARCAVFVTEAARNDFRLPVREGEWALAVTGVCSNLRALSQWTDAVQPGRMPPGLRSHISTTEILRLEPAARALYR